MKNVVINLSPEHSEKLTAITKKVVQDTQKAYITGSGRELKLEPRKLTASAIARTLLDQAIDEAYAELS
jgi:predicted RNase H-related nuclease YkuK (DUF458 family)